MIFRLMLNVLQRKRARVEREIKMQELLVWPHLRHSDAQP